MLTTASPEANVGQGQTDDAAALPVLVGVVLALGLAAVYRFRRSSVAPRTA